MRQDSVEPKMRVQIFIIQALALATISINPSHSHEEATNTTKVEPVQEDPLKLSCQAGEQRYFNYESTTKIWGSNSGQQVRLRATLRVRCMESPSNSTLKYMAEVMRLIPLFGNDTLGADELRSRARLANPSNDQLDLRAEPVFEEVGEAISETAKRVKRSVSGWFTKTWSSVKDFFTNIFTSNERTSIAGDRALNETGLDIAGLCKSGGRADKTPPSGLPLDESLFEDLDEPKLFYAGASVDSNTGSSTAYEFASSVDQNDISETNTEDSTLSFFDDPKSSIRSKRATTGALGSDLATSEQEHLIRMPFVFVQSKLGRIMEIRFSSDESDSAVKNFKRHLCDLFATNLDQTKSQMQETTPVGQHTSKYIVDQTSDSRAIKQSLIKDNESSKERSSESNELVRALASVAGTSIGPDGFQSIEGRDPSSADTVEGKPSNGLSVLRSINSTSSIQLSSSAIMPEIDRMLVSVKQLQHISSGRMTGSAGQLSMSLLQATEQKKQESYRHRRSAPEDSESSDVNDIADLLQVFTSFQLQLVPRSRVGKFELPARRLKRSANLRSEESVVANTGKGDNHTHNGESPRKQLDESKRKLEPYVIRSPPKGSQEFVQLMDSLKTLESNLNLASVSLVSESNQFEGHRQRLEILRDQVQMRLNEEFVRNRLRKHATPANLLSKPDAGNVAASTQSSERARSASQVQAKPHDLGLSLTQLILDSGFTAKRKGSVYTTLEEIVELETMLGEELQSDAISKLLRDTVRLDKLRAHCKSSIASADEVRSESANLHLSWPFGERVEQADSLENQRLSKSIETIRARNQRRLRQCKQVSELLLRAGDRQAAEMVLDLTDECNRRLLAAAKDEELGYGPVSRYYRQLRQRFTEMLASLSRPSDAFLDKLVNRLTFIADPAAPISGQKRSGDEAEFDYVNRASSSPSSKYNKSLLSEEDDYNNSDGTGSLVMTLTTLAAKPSISKAKRASVIDRILIITRQSQCSPLVSPDLDILESMGAFQQPQEEIVGRVLSLARKCRHVEQYLIGSVHALQYQLRNPAVQRFFVDHLRSQNTSCTMKSEMVLTLIQAIVVEDLKPLRNTSQANRERTWPSVGRNQVDDVLSNISLSTDRRYAQDKKCLQSLIENYQNKKIRLQEPSYSPDLLNQKTRRSPMKSQPRRLRREIPKHDFWDEANCKRWSIGDANSQAAPTSGLDDLDDSSLGLAVATSQRAARGRRYNRRSQRDVDSGGAGATSAFMAHLNSNSTLIRRRHKCTASKRFGPKNAQAMLKAEVVNDLIGQRDENKFLARFRLGTNFLGNQIDVGRMYFWYQRRTTRALVNILGKSLWDTSHSCQDTAPKHFVYMPLFDFNIWVVKVAVGLRLQAEMGFFSNCQKTERNTSERPSQNEPKWSQRLMMEPEDELEIYPSISLRASGEASARFVAARAGMSLASQYGYLGNIRVGRQPESCMSIESAHQPMNVTFASWFQLWDGDCHYWGSRNRAQPAATKWRLDAKKPTIWLQDECLADRSVNKSENVILNKKATELARDSREPDKSNSSTISSVVLFP